MTSTFANGGVERVTQILSQVLQQAGHEITIVTGPIHHKDYQLPAGVDRIILHNYDAEVMDMKFLEKGFDAVVFQQFYIPETYRQIGYYASHGVKVMAIDHIVYMYHLQYGIQHENKYKWLRHQMYPQTDALVALSPFDASIWKRVGVRSRFIPNPTSFETVQVTKRPNNIIFMGRMKSPQKQSKLAVNVMQILAQKNVDATLHMLGSDEQPTAAYVRKLGLKNVNVVGFSSRVKDFLLNSSVMIMPSKYEGYPMAIIEAISQGLAVVAFEMEYLAIMKCGVIQVSKQNTLQMAIEVQKLLENETLRQEIVTQGQQCLQKLNDMVVPRWEELLEKVVYEDEQVDFEDEVEQSWVEMVFGKELKALGRGAKSHQKSKKVVKKVIKRVKRRR